MINGVNKKKIIILTGVCICTLGMGIPVMAGNSFRRANIKSTGSITFEDGKVSLDSSDLQYLADEIDSLEETYKTTTVDALNSIGTYLKNDGSITYDSSQNEADTEEEKTRLSFGNIMEGIKNSQSVESLSSIQATDKDGNLLYYTDENAQTNKDSCSVTTTDTGYPLYYKAVTAENLSAGTAAWVNGNLIQGNGSDNVAYVEQINTQISQGTATEDKVLSGFTFSSSCGKNVAGTMINQGELNWNPAVEEVYNVPAGYYSGGTLSSSNAYNSGYNLGYEAGITNSNVKVILLGTLGNSFNLSSYENFQNFKIGEHIFFVPLSMSVTVYNNFAHYYTGSSHSDDVLGASSSGTNNSLLNYDSNTGLLTTSTTASTGNAQVKEYDGHGYNFDASDASAKVTIAGNVYLVF